MADVIAREAASRQPSSKSGHPASPFAFTPTELWIFLAATAAIVFARLPAFVYAHSVDDYSFNTHPHPIPHYFPIAMGDGRFGTALLLTVLHALGLRQGTTPAVSALLAALATAGVGVLICRLWNTRESRLATAAVIGMITLHPYLADSSTFQVITLINALAFLCAACALYLMATRASLLLPIALVFLCFSIYQATAGYFLAAALATTLLDLLVAPDSDTRFTTGWRLLGRAVVVLAIAAPAYLVANRIAIAISGMKVAGRFGLVPLSGMGNRIGQIGTLLWTIFLRYEPVLPLAPKLLMLAMACAAAAAVAWHLRSNWLVVAAIPVMLAVLAMASVGVVAVAVDWWPAPRTLQAFAIFWAFVLAAGMKVVAPRLRSMLAAAGLLLCVSFAGMSNHILDDRLRANLRDAMEIERIVGRLEALPGFEGVHSLAFAGDQWTWPTPLDTLYWDTNLSSMGHDWSKTIFINEITGYNFGQPTAAMKQAAATYCGTAPLWPAEQSLAIRGDFAIVCLAK